MFRNTARFCLAIDIVVVILTLALLTCSAAAAQETLLMPVQGNTLNVLDLDTLTVKQTIDAAGYMAFAYVGNNQRLALVGSSNGSYMSTLDFTAGQMGSGTEVNRTYGNCPYTTPAFTADNKYLLFQDQCDNALHVYDPSLQQTIRKVLLPTALGSNSVGAPGSIVVVGTKAYVTSVAPNLNRPAITYVDLRTFRTYQIKISSGQFDNAGFWSPNAAATPDGKYVIMAQTSPDGLTYHLLFISTASQTLVMDKAISVDPFGFLITPVNSPGNIYGYLLGFDTNNQFSATLVDLNTGSPTFGQLLPQSEVLLESYFPNGIYSAALNPEGTRLLIGGRKGGPNPNPNIVQIDTTQMLNNPNGAIKNYAIVSNGVNPHALWIGTINSTAPPTAPTVASVNPPSITNNQDNVITVTGTNFAPGALVRVGTMPPMTAKVDSSTALHVTVPQAWPARANQDIVVSNPNLGAPIGQQYQSGVLAGKLNILPTPAFAPNNEFATYDGGDFSFGIYDSVQQTMTHAVSNRRPFDITFNADGRAIYGSGSGMRGPNTPAEAAEWSTQDGSLLQAIPFETGSAIQTNTQIAASVNPLTGTPAVFVPVRENSGGILDVTLKEVDTTTGSPTFNTVVETIPSGLGLPNTSGLIIWAVAATADGKYVFVNYTYSSDAGLLGFIAVFDVKNATVTSIPTTMLGVAPQQTYMSVTPDSKCLLMMPQAAQLVVGGIGVFDISVNPTTPTLISTIYGKMPPGQGDGGTLYLYSWKIVGNELFALETNFGAVLTFNYNSGNLDFSQTGIYFDPRLRNAGAYIDASSDGALLYVPVGGYDLVSVLDAKKLAGGQPPWITNIGSFRFPFMVAVSPLSLSMSQLKIVTTTLPAATQGVQYLASLQASGGAPPYTWSLGQGSSLPAGLTLSPTGLITGVPTVHGNFGFTIQVTDSQSNQAAFPFSLTVQQAAALKVLTSSLTPGPVNQPYYSQLSATGGVPPYSWSVSLGTLPTGLNLSTAGTISGTPTAMGPSSFTVQVTDSAVPHGSAIQPLSLTINGNGNPAALQGHYAFAISGFDGVPDELTMVGSFVADGAGNITSGEADYNAVTEGPSQVTMTGNYSIDAAGVGTMTLSFSGHGNWTFAFVMNPSGDGRIIPYQQGDGWGAGVLRLQDTSAFNLSKLVGTYVFEGVGADRKGSRFAQAGELALDGKGNVSNGMFDANADGKGFSDTLTGTLGTVDSNGRFTGRLINGSDKKISNLAFYVVSATELVFAPSDNIQNTDGAIEAGSAYLQSGTGKFNSGSLSGNVVFYDQGVHLPQDGGNPVAGAGIGNFDGIIRMRYVRDENSGGNLDYKTGYFWYSVASNGRGNFNDGSVATVFYLVGPNKGVYVDGPTGSKAQLGFLEAQSNGPFSNISLMGSYSGGALQPASAISQLTIDTLASDGAGTSTFNTDSYGSKGIGQNRGDSGPYTITSNGRGFTPDGTVIYVISPTRFAVVISGNYPRVELGGR